MRTLLLAFILTGLLCSPSFAQKAVHLMPAADSPAIGPALQSDLPASHGSNDIAQAWLSTSQTRISHGALGDVPETSVLTVRTRGGAMLSYALPDDSVFEDLIPRVHDLNGDGHDEVILVRSRLHTGSSLMLLGIRAGKLMPLAESVPLDQPGQWLNPVGVADVDGDGRMEILVVLTPHSNGTLTEYNLVEDTLVQGHHITGVTNHVMGSRDQGMSALMDANGDGHPDVIVPATDRRSIHALAFDEKAPLEFSRIYLPARAAGNFEMLPPATLIVPLEDGRRMVIEWR